MFCERCGIQLLPRQSFCGHCGIPPAHHWLQFVGLVVLTVAAAYHSFLIWHWLPRLLATEEASAWVRAWLWVEGKFSLYGWLVLAVALLVWCFWPRYGYEPELEVRVARGALIILLLAGLATWLLGWIPDDSTAGVRAGVSYLPGAASGLGWAMVVLVLAILGLNGETRHRLLGDGRTLSVIGLALLFLSSIAILLAMG